MLTFLLFTNVLAQGFQQRDLRAELYREIPPETSQQLWNRALEEKIQSKARQVDLFDIAFVESIEFENPFSTGPVKMSRGYNSDNPRVDEHLGLDLYTTDSDRGLLAVADGTIEAVGVSPTFGNYIILKLSASPDYLRIYPRIERENYYVLYAHLKNRSKNDPEIREGMEVFAGKTWLGTMGNTPAGKVGIHLHLEILKGAPLGYEGGLIRQRTALSTMNPELFPYFYKTMLDREN